MSGKSVTGKRIHAEIKKLDKAVCSLYAQKFPAAPAGEKFWAELLHAEKVLMERLSPRPLGLMEIRQACTAYTAAFKRACKHGKQARDPSKKGGKAAR